MHDGTGLRTTVFLKGCPLDCKWCHNPETKSKDIEISLNPKLCIMCGECLTVCKSGAQIFEGERKIEREKCVACGLCAKACKVGAISQSGTEMSVDEILNEVMKDYAFYGEDGGLTVSGGEPVYQQDGLIRLLKKAKEEGLNTCIETSGMFSEDVVPKLLKYTDLFLYDIKDTDKQRLKENTGGDFDIIVKNFYELDRHNAKTVMRCILIPNLNMNNFHLDELAEIYKKLKNCMYIELLPYHPYGTAKAENIGREDVTVYDKPEKDDIIKCAEYLSKKSIPVKCYGSIN